MNNKFFVIAILTQVFFNFTDVTAQNSTNSSKEVASLIAKKRAFNKDYGSGYRVQIYYGDEAKAKSTLNKFRLYFPNIYNTLAYDSPYWKVHVGNYKTKLEADKALLQFKEQFSGIIVIPLTIK